MKRTCLVLLLLSIPCFNSKAENLIENHSFESGNLSGWNLGILGDKKGKIEIVKIAHSGQFSAGIYSPTRASWTFLRQSFKLPVGSQLVATAWVKTHSKRLRLAITEGYIWGADATGHRHKYVCSSGSGRWEKLVIKMTTKREMLVSIAIGFDYGSRDSQAIIDDVYLGTGNIPDKDNNVNEADDTSIRDIIIPPALRSKAEILISEIEQRIRDYDSLKKTRKSLPVGLIKSIDKAIAEGRQKQAKFKTDLTPYLSGEKFLSEKEWNNCVNEIQRYIKSHMQYVVWNKDIHLNVKPNEMPSTLDSLKTSKLCACINEWESTAFMITNLSSHPVNMRIEASDLTGPDKIKAKDLLIRKAIFVIDNSKIYADPLVKMDGSLTICIPAHQTRQIWITINTAGLKAGLYKGKIKLVPLDNLNFQPYEFDFVARILPVKLPSDMPINVFNFDYKAFRNELCLNDLIAHRVNTFQVNISSKDFERYATKDLINKLRAKGLIKEKSIYFEVWFIRRTGWKPEYADWIKRFVKYTREQLGLDYKQWILHIYDETLCPAFVEAAKQIKKIDPNIQIFSDWSGSIEELKAISPYIDVWCPQYMQIDKMPDAFKYMKKTKKPIWTYECDSMPAKPVLIYHVLPLIAFKHKLDGVAFWTYSPCRWFNNRAGRNYGLYYWNSQNDSPIASRRWEIWRDGLDDYLYLYILKQKFQTDERKVAMIDKIVSDVVNNPTPEKLSGLKERLVNDLFTH